MLFLRQTQVKYTMAKSMKTNLMFSIFIITPVEKRTNPKGDYGTTYCIDSVTKSVKTLYIPIQLINKLKLNKYYLVTNAVVGDNVHLRDQTKVMDASAFEFDHALVDQILKPKTVNVTEALSSPEKTRLTVSGVVDSCSDIYTTEKSRRRVLQLKSPEKEGPTLTVKMWGEKAQMTVPVRETSIRIKNIEVNNYKGQIEGNSTSLTEIEIDAEEEEIQGEVEGASFEENDMWIVVNRTLYNIKNNIMETLFPGYKFIPGKEITASVKGYKLTKLFQKNKRTKKE